MSLTRDLARLNLDSDGDITGIGSSKNLLTNGDFTTNTTGWAATGSTLAVVSNELQLTPGSGVNGFANQQVDNLVIGRSYIASVTVTVDAASYSRLYIGTSANGNETISNVNLGTGTHSFIFTATATTHHFALVVGGGTGQVTRFDNAKLIEANDFTFSAGYGKINGILAVDRATDGTSIDVQKAGTSQASIGVSGSAGTLVLNKNTSSGVGLFGSTNNGGCLLPTDGNAGAVDDARDLGRQNIRWRDVYLSGGVYLGGTGASNKLDDYEEGTWTPNIYKGGSALPVNSRYGYYRKVGGLLWLSFYWYHNGGLSSQTNNSNVYSVQGLPFAVVSITNSAYQFIPAGYTVVSHTTYYEEHRWQANATNELYLYGTRRQSTHSSGVLEWAGTGVLMTDA